MCTACLCLLLSGAPSSRAINSALLFTFFFFFLHISCISSRTQIRYLLLERASPNHPHLPPPTLSSDSTAPRCIFLRCIQAAHFSKTQNSPTSRGQTPTWRHQVTAVFLFIKNTYDLSRARCPAMKLRNQLLSDGTAACTLITWLLLLLLFQTRLCCRPGRPHA